MASDQIIHNTKQYKRTDLSLQIDLSVVEWVLLCFTCIKKKIKLVYYFIAMTYVIILRILNYFDFTQ